MYDFSNITFIIFARIDNDERARNLAMTVAFYRSQGNAKFIIVEDSTEMRVPQLIQLTQEDLYIYTHNTGEWNKSAGYNRAIRLARTNILCLNDVDVIIHPDQIIQTAAALNNDTNAGMIFPYNGLFLCVSYDVKYLFERALNYNELDKYYPDSSAINYSNGGIFVGHNQSRGGCVMVRRDNMLTAGGYNPLFRGWGYEDDEAPTRIHKLGYTVARINGDRQPCWHLPHQTTGSSLKETQPHYEHNRAIASKVDHMNKSDLQAYIKEWEV